MENNNVLENMKKAEIDKKISDSVFKPEDSIPEPNALETVQPSTEDLKAVDGTVVVDPNTGMNRVVSDEIVNKDMSDESLTDLYNVDDKKLDKDIFNTSDFDETIKDVYGLKNAESILKLKQLAYDYDNGKVTTGLFNRLPNEFKAMIGSQIGTFDPAIANRAAKEFLELIIHEFKTDIQFNKEFVDFETALRNEINSMDFGQLYIDHTVEQMDKINALIEKYKDTEPEKVAHLIEIKEPYKDAEEFTTLKAKAREIHNLKKYTKNEKRFYKECDNFNYKYKAHQKINFSNIDVKTIPLILKRRLDPEKYSEDDIMKFTALFLRVTLNYSPDNIPEHVFMYYTIRNINLLDILNVESENYKKIISNVEEVINIIKEEEAKNGQS